MSPSLSTRAEELIEEAQSSVLGNALFKTFASQYDQEVNPTGVVNCGLAENALMQPWLAEFFERPGTLKLERTDFTYGTSLVGSLRIFDALASLFATYFSPASPVLPSHIVTGSGLSGVLDHLASVIANPGDGIIIPRPHYNAFVEDLTCRAEVKIVGVDIEDGQHGQLGEVEALDREMVRRSTETGAAKVKAVLLTNPHNPLGFCYSREVLLAYCRFAEKWDIFLICDEIYALSVYDSDLPSALPFTSILSIDVAREAACDTSRIIQLYGMSKDFCSNGLRIGSLVAQSNPRLHHALSTIAAPGHISSAADALWSALLNSSELSTFLKLNKQALGDAYAFVSRWLTYHDLPFRRAQAGHFILVDLRRFLREESHAAEVQLLEKLVDGGVYMGPGFSYGVSSSGFFRLTFSL